MRPFWYKTYRLLPNDILYIVSCAIQSYRHAHDVCCAIHIDILAYITVLTRVILLYRVKLILGRLTSACGERAFTGESKGGAVFFEHAPISHFLFPCIK